MPQVIGVQYYGLTSPDLVDQSPAKKTADRQMAYQVVKDPTTYPNKIISSESRVHSLESNLDDPTHPMQLKNKLAQESERKSTKDDITVEVRPLTSKEVTYQGSDNLASSSRPRTSGIRQNVSKKHNSGTSV